jgi:phosphoribosylaminoimidazolecarboxamide formyltransferase/IMP cyclohydrolase
MSAHRRIALLSVSDKRGLAEFAAGLERLGFDVVSTGGTHQALADQGIKVKAVSEITGFPEILDGRVKTLHPRIHGAILADRSKAAHLAQLEEHAIAPIELVVVNLYPFAETVAAPGSTFAEAIEMIDVGGPCMVRAAAKNHAHVTVVVDPDDYPEVLAALERGAAEGGLRRRLAAKAFRHTQSYDEAIAAWLSTQTDMTLDEDELPPHLHLDLERELVPRYGENPHQAAAVYRVRGGRGILGGMRQIQGKELSWNNLLDADAARKLVALFDQPAIAIIKHNNPCGVGRGNDLIEAYRRALATDPTSAFGSIVAANRPVDRAAAEAMRELFIEVLVAPGYDGPALEVFGAKKNLRLLECPAYRPAPGESELRAIDGGYLAQIPDAARDDAAAWSCPTRRQPTDLERRALRFAWDVARYVKSNAIVLATGEQTVGIGAGQMSRVDSCRIAIEKAQLEVRGTVAASDAFFPFRDGLDILARAGVSAIVQPGGSKRDDEIVAAADEHGIAMLFTGTRHFRH